MANATAQIPSHAKSAAVTARESTESIVVAFALAFIFRAFIVEAFVIPTGSMAPTLYGQQVTHTCSTCGYEFARGDLPPNAPRTMELTLQCPNCASTADKISGADITNPSSGDRILVHKAPFSIGGPVGPKRWGVTVFKDPHNGTVNFIKRLVGLPGEFLEIIQGDVYAASLDEIRKSKDKDLIDLADQLRLDLYHYAHPDEHGGPVVSRAAAEDRYQAINTRLIPYLKIKRKAVDAPDAQKSLWFNVYNHDYLPNYDSSTVRPEARVGWSALVLSIDSITPDLLSSGGFPADLRKALEIQKISVRENPAVNVREPDRKWVVGSSAGDLLIVREQSRLAVYEAAAATAWDTSTREIRFNSDSDRLLSVHFTGKPIEDFYAYNFFMGGNSSASRVPVGDLRLSFIWWPESGNGGLSLEMNRDKDTFDARIHLDGTVQIERFIDGAKKPVVIGQAKLEPLPHGKAVSVEFSNVDFRVCLSINGREVIASKDSQYSPDIPALLRCNPDDPRQTQSVTPPQVRIGGYQMHCRIEHLELDRDEYYRSSLIGERVSSPQPDEPVAGFVSVRNPFCEWPGWGTQGWPILLRDGRTKEYFMLGDNSPGSKDSRLWWEIGPHLQHLGEQYQVGTVPDDQLIGRAFFVYWPSGYRRAWTGDLGIVPNFGRMRWIR